MGEKSKKYIIDFLGFLACPASDPMFSAVSFRFGAVALSKN